MAVQIDEGAAEVLRNKIEDLGVRVHTSKNTKNIAHNGEGSGDYRFTMEFADGESLGTDMIVFSAGIRPRDNLARESELDMGERGGIVIGTPAKPQMNKAARHRQNVRYGVAAFLVW